MYLIYKVTSPSNKIYVGLTSETLKKRKYRHTINSRYGMDLPVNRAILKYGNELSWEVIHSDIKTFEEAKQLEIFYIDKFRSFGDLGYNCTIGGDGYNPGTRPKCPDCGNLVRNWNSKRCQSCYKKYIKTDEWKAEHSARQKKRFLDPKQREFMASLRKGKSPSNKGIKKCPDQF